MTMDPEKMDHFSKLPDAVISHILSFIPTTKEAASTSVLAKRWRDLFAYVPNLKIDDNVFLHPEERKREKDGILESFVDFVDRVLALQGDSPIKTFSLKVREGVGADCVDRWICNVLRRGVSHLDLFVELAEYEGYSLPYEISISKTLVKFRTGFGVDLYSWDNDIFLPMIKTLVFDSVSFGRGQFQTLLPACPVLEELMLLKMEWRDSNEILSSSSLRKLKISLGEGCSGTFSFDTPNLVFLDYNDNVADDYPIVNLGNLVEAGINLDLPEGGFYRARDNVWKLIHGLRNVKTLQLSPVAFVMFSLCCESMPVFKNLTVLTIESVMIQGWKAMPFLLRNCPHLESLFLRGLMHAITNSCGDVCNCILRENKGLSLKSCPVKKIKISGFRGTMEEMGMIKHFLEYLPSLEEMKIIAETDEPTVFEIPNWLGVIEDTLMDYDKTYTKCNVIFRVQAFLYRKWTREWRRLRG